MPNVVVRPRALADLAEIWAFIAEDSVTHADRFAALVDRPIARLPCHLTNDYNDYDDLIEPGRA